MSLQAFHAKQSVAEPRDIMRQSVLFHTHEAATGKARSPTAVRRVRRTTNDDDEAEQTTG